MAFARGTFNLKMVPRGTVDEGEGSPFGWVSVDKGFRGDPEGASRGEMLTALTDVSRVLRAIWPSSGSGASGTLSRAASPSNFAE